MVFGIFGIVYGYFAAMKYAGVSGRFVGTRNRFRFAVRGAERTCVVSDRADYFALFIFVFYVAGFLGAGFVLYGLFYALALMNRP